jgi:hypothetical protein
MLSSGANVIIWNEMLSSGMQCYHLGQNVIIWDEMLSSGANVIIWDKMLLSGANVIMVSSGANVIIWCYHVMLSSGMITPPFLVFPGNFTHSFKSSMRLSKSKHRCQYSEFSKMGLLIGKLSSIKATVHHFNNFILLFIEIEARYYSITYKLQVTKHADFIFYSLIF